VRFYLKDYDFELSSEVAKKRNGEIKKSPGSEIDSSRNHVFSSDPLAVSFSGKVFKLRAMPWLGGRFMVNENGNFKELSGGGEVFGYLAKHIGYYAQCKIHLGE